MSSWLYFLYVHLSTQDLYKGTETILNELWWPSPLPISWFSACYSLSKDVLPYLQCLLLIVPTSATTHSSLSHPTGQAQHFHSLSLWSSQYSFPVSQQRDAHPVADSQPSLWLTKKARKVPGAHSEVSPQCRHRSHFSLLSSSGSLRLLSPSCYWVQRVRQWTAKQMDTKNWPQVLFPSGKQ